jgi:hypothetical protein
VQASTTARGLLPSNPPSPAPSPTSSMRQYRTWLASLLGYRIQPRGGCRSGPCGQGDREPPATETSNGCEGRRHGDTLACGRFLSEAASARRSAIAVRHWVQQRPSTIDPAPYP